MSQIHPEAEVHSELANSGPEKKLSEILKEIFVSESQEKSSLGELIDRLDHHGTAIVLILFALPSALPIPAAGYSTLLAVPLLIIGIRMLLGKEQIWLPERVREKDFEPAAFEKISTKMISAASFLERFAKPRLPLFTSKAVVQFVFGSLICLLALSMALPIPGTNTLPAGGIFLMGFGLLEDDGLIALLGFIYSLAALCLTLLIIFFGYEVVKGLLENLF